MEIVSTITGLIVSIVAVCISIRSLKQTQYSIEQANRPYVVVYRDYIQALDSVYEYLIIKNFGKSGAVIKSLKFEPDYSEVFRDRDIFKNISNTFIAPGQAITTVTTHKPSESKRKGVTEVTIEYYSGGKEYNEKFLLNEELYSDFLFAKTSMNKDRPLQEVVIKATEEILRRNL